MSLIYKHRFALTLNYPPSVVLKDSARLLCCYCSYLNARAKPLQTSQPTRDEDRPVVCIWKVRLHVVRLRVVSVVVVAVDVVYD